MILVFKSIMPVVSEQETSVFLALKSSQTLFNSHWKLPNSGLFSSTGWGQPIQQGWHPFRQLWGAANTARQPSHSTLAAMKAEILWGLTQNDLVSYPASTPKVWKTIFWASWKLKPRYFRTNIFLLDWHGWTMLNASPFVQPCCQPMTKVMQKLQAMIDQARLFDVKTLQVHKTMCQYESWKTMSHRNQHNFASSFVLFAVWVLGGCMFDKKWVEDLQWLSGPCSDSFSLLLLLFKSWLIMDQTQEIIA